MFRLPLFFTFLLLLAQGSNGFWSVFASSRDGNGFEPSSSKNAMALSHPKADVGSISPGSVKMGVVTHAVAGGGVGANWGSQASHRLPPEIVVRMLRENGIQKVKLFDSDYDTLRALSGSSIQVMVGIPNDMLSTLAHSSKAAERWVSQYAFLDGGGNSTPVWALRKAGFPDLPILVGEIGWPTDGDRNANPDSAQRFNRGLMARVKAGRGTPMRPGPIDAYLFSLVDEDEKSIRPGNFERHWGVFGYDGQPKYELDLGAGALAPARNVSYLESKWCILKASARLEDPKVAESVSYACGLADCTCLGYETSCGGLDARGNISYAFNSYYQKNNQMDDACKFSGLGTVTRADPTIGNCRFGVMIKPYYGGAGRIASGWGVVLCVGVFLWTGL